MADFARAGDSIPGQFWNFERNQQFFGCEDFSEEDVDVLVAAEEKKPGNEWMLEQPQRVKRVYVMSLEFAKAHAPTVGRLPEVG